MKSIALTIVSFWTILRNEFSRILRIWTQSLLPPIIIVTLYFLIFGKFIGTRIGNISGTPYIQFIAPGLIMMNVITNSYMNVVSSLYLARFQRSIEAMLISPIHNVFILLGFVFGGMLRGILVGLLVTFIALFFTHLSIFNIYFMLIVIVLTTFLFSLAGFLNGIFANSFDDTAIVPTFILTPLVYLGGVFYSTNLLPEFWQTISLLNPMLHIVNTFRYSLLGISDINVVFSLTVLGITCFILFVITIFILNKGIGIRN